MSATTFDALLRTVGFTLDDLNKVSQSQIQEVGKLAEKITISSSDGALLSFADPEVYDPSIVGKHLFLILGEYRAANKEAQFPEDLKVLVGLQVKRGSFTAKNLARVSPAGQKRIAELYASFKIAAKLTVANKKSAVTLQRLAGTFPLLSCNWASIVGVPVSGPFGSECLPKCLLTQSAACLIPINQKGDGILVAKMLFEAVMAFSCDQSLKFPGNTEADVRNKQLTYVNAMRDSRTLSKKQRESALDSLDLKAEYDSIAACLAVKKVSVCTKKQWEDFF